MALKKTVNTDYGFSVADAYHRVEAMAISDKETITFFVRSYKTSDKTFFAQKNYSASYDMTKENPYVQAYNYLKKQPEFVGAVDC